MLVPSYYNTEYLHLFIRLNQYNKHKLGETHLYCQQTSEIWYTVKIVLVFKTPYKISRGSLNMFVLTLKIWCLRRWLLPWGKGTVNALIWLMKVVPNYCWGSQTHLRLRQKRGLFSKIVFNFRKYIRSPGSNLWIPGKESVLYKYIFEQENRKRPNDLVEVGGWGTDKWLPKCCRLKTYLPNLVGQELRNWNVWENETK